ncbi:APC family permease [Microbacterium thalassium]|uniref:Amino acid transporter n=1 Tax=Microbacterium thalassium TaxID=362649 RepID=A0A7X0FN01_9MICO|nr:APC family permease [Microbacterium thalassium]MBB6389962.1 amino acid transporter [Microbacterium thalassium]GLK24648.1 amino acid permease [Microbacterium thalassium]
MSTTTNQKRSAAETSTDLMKGSIRFLTIVLMVTAAAAPLVVVSTYIPISYAYGSGFATALTYVSATLILLVFSVGFAQMAKRITAAGAFYNFTTQGLGKPLGLGAGWTVMAAYSMIVPAISGGFGYFASHMLELYLGWSVPWWICSIAAIALMWLISYFEVTVAGRVLGAALTLEIIVIFIIATAVIVQGGAQGQMPEVFSPAQFLAAPAIGIGFFFAFWSWIGFETTAIYGEETTDPKKAVPRATYIAVITLGVFYSFAAYAGIVGFGDETMSQAESLLGDYFFVLAEMYTWQPIRILLDFLVLTSFFACAFAFHNNASRYLYSMGRDHILPRSLGRTHPRHKSPFVANGVQAAVAIVVVALFALAGADPLLQLGTWLPIFCTAGVVFVQLLVSLAVIAYFNKVGRHSAGDWWKTLVAPVVGALAQAVVLVLLVIYIPFLAGADVTVVNLIPVYVAAITLAGVGFALYLRKRHVSRYDRIGTIYDEEELPDVMAVPLPHHDAKD